MNMAQDYLSLGAGVQSSTLALMAAKGLVTPMPVAAIFADTQADRVRRPFHSNSEWRRLRDEEPVQFEKAVSVNFVSTPYLHRSCKPLDEVDLRTDEERGQATFDWQDECEGMCGV